jgi:hypothetical protein
MEGDIIIPWLLFATSFMNLLFKFIFSVTGQAITLVLLMNILLLPCCSNMKMKIWRLLVVLIYSAIKIC